MPYIDTNKVAQMRKAIRVALPDFTISVTKRHHSSVDVTIMRGPIAPANINMFWYKDHLGPDKENRLDLIALIDTIKAEIFKVETPRELVYDGDYGSVPTFYYDIAFGRWDKPYVCTDESLPCCPNCGIAFVPTSTESHLDDEKAFYSCQKAKAA